MHRGECFLCFSHLLYGRTSPFYDPLGKLIVFRMIIDPKNSLFTEERTCQVLQVRT